MKFKKRLRRKMRVVVDFETSYLASGRTISINGPIVSAYTKFLPECPVPLSWRFNAVHYDIHTFLYSQRKSAPTLTTGDLFVNSKSFTNLRQRNKIHDLLNII